MKKFINQYWLIILLAVIATVLFVIQLASNEQQVQLGVVSVEPLSGAIEESPSRIVITFNRAIEPQDQIELIISPQVQVKENIEEDKVIYEFVSELEGKYYFEIKANGQSMYSWNYEIPVQAVPTTSPSQNSESPRGDPQIIYDDAEEIYNNYPLIKYMPYSSDNFAINYLEPLKLGVKIKGTDVEAIKQEVLRWIEDMGVDPSSHEIIWL